jgi:hypothetical protein
MRFIERGPVGQGFARLPFPLSLAYLGVIVELINVVPLLVLLPTLAIASQVDTNRLLRVIFVGVMTLMVGRMIFHGGFELLPQRFHPGFGTFVGFLNPPLFVALFVAMRLSRPRATYGLRTERGVEA